MTVIVVDQEVPKYQSYAAERTRGLYNVEADDGAHFQLKVDIPTDRTDWKVGMIVGPSGSGKSSVVRGILEDPFDTWKEWTGGRWPKDKPIIEALGGKNYAKATGALAAVGLGSVPSWLRPHRVLSTGEQFRADMAKLLTSGERKVVLDEFTSVLDRQVAQVAAGAFAKAWRRGDRQIVLSTCHHDVLDWVQPDWWLDTREGLDEFAGDRGVIRAREGSFPTAADHAGYQGNRLGTVEC